LRETVFAFPLSNGFGGDSALAALPNLSCLTPSKILGNISAARDVVRIEGERQGGKRYGEQS